LFAALDSTHFVILYSSACFVRACPSFDLKIALHFVELGCTIGLSMYVGARSARKFWSIFVPVSFRGNTVVASLVKTLICSLVGYVCMMSLDEMRTKPSCSSALYPLQMPADSFAFLFRWSRFLYFWSIAGVLVLEPVYWFDFITKRMVMIYCAIGLSSCLLSTRA
jgi:hypothetical protein